MKRKLKIGTRGSKLALWQANHLLGLLENVNIDAELVIVKTRGDKDLRPLKEIAGDGFFTKDLENMLLHDDIDLAIHSAKDLASMRHSLLPWKAVGERANTSDVIIVKKDVYNKSPKFEELTIGTSSPRRKAQIAIDYPKARISELRGNVPTRLSKVSSGELDAVVLAKAGLDRLGLLPEKESDLIAIELDWTTAPCQGILALQGKAEALDYVSEILNEDLSRVALIEKSILAFLGGGCHMAVGANITEDQAPTLKFFLNKDSSDFKFSKTYESISEMIVELYSDLSSEINSPIKEKQEFELILTQTVSNQNKVMSLKDAEDFSFKSLPLIEISSSVSDQEVKVEIEKLKSTKALVLTSQYAARIFFMEFFNQGHEVAELKNLDILCVGKTTYNKVKEFGFQPLELKWKAYAKSMMEYIEENYSTTDSFSFIGVESARILNLLEQSNYNLRTLFIYSNSAPDWAGDVSNTDLGNSPIAFAAPSSVKNFVDHYGAENLKNRKVFAMGPTTEDEISKYTDDFIESTDSGSWQSLFEQVRKEGK